MYPILDLFRQVISSREKNKFWLNFFSEYIILNNQKLFLASKKQAEKKQKTIVTKQFHFSWSLGSLLSLRMYVLFIYVCILLLIDKVKNPSPLKPLSENKQCKNNKHGYRHLIREMG